MGFQGAEEEERVARTRRALQEAHETITVTERRQRASTPRARLFKALEDLDEEVGDLPDQASRGLRKQAVIEIVNALYPKPDKR